MVPHAATPTLAPANGTTPIATTAAPTARIVPGTPDTRGVRQKDGRDQRGPDEHGGALVADAVSSGFRTAASN